MPREGYHRHRRTERRRKNNGSEPAAANDTGPPRISERRRNCSRSLALRSRSQRRSRRRRMMIERIDRLVATGKSFALETTCAGHRQAKLLRSCRTAGYRVTLFFLWLPSPEAAIQRVAQRVARGGHHIPDDVIARRYSAGLYNMRRMFLPLAHAAAIYDNSLEPPVLIAEKESDSSFTV